jgi:murein L,D-transpeptidase YafK
MRAKSVVFLFMAIIVVLLAAAVFAPREFETAKSELVRQFPALRHVLLPPDKTPVSKRLNEAGFALGQPLLIRIYKQESKLELWMKRAAVYERVWTYPICKWSGALGPKLKEGDKQSPEGYYFASRKQLLPTSRHHRAINTGFPNSFDSGHGRTGTVLMIHGACTSIGCYAMTDPAIDDIYTIVEAALDNGQLDIPMHLYPFRMTKENLDRHSGHPWISFWRNLAEGDALFAATGLPPPVWTCNGKYEFKGSSGNCQKVAAW